MTHPSGFVTFLFTDIEGSTQHWEQRPRAMAVAFARQETLVRAAILAHAGYPYKMVGDAFQAAFQSPLAAITAAVDAQRVLSLEDWGEVGTLKVRMALHIGETEERGDDYVGPLLNRLARLLAAGHGGQILLTEEVAGAVRWALPAGWQVEDLGEWRLKDLLAPVRIFQLTVPDLDGRFPPLATLDVRATSLPVQSRAFIGRVQEVAELTAVLQREEIRLLTLTGPGGTGKTRLALQVAAGLIDHYPDGVSFVDLSPLTDGAFVLSAIAGTLGVPEQPGTPLRDTLVAQLRGKRMLLVLDNCEQVLDAAGAIAALVDSCLGVRVLATSRIPLHLSAEHEYAVAPLPVPDPDRLPPLDALTKYDAVQLFVDRASAVRHGFAATEENVAAIAGICARLDGLPLALELAAARIKLFPPETLLQRLDNRLRMLTGGARDRPTRQQTLRGAIDWSYGLLDRGEQALFRTLSVFAGGCTLEGAEAVYPPDLEERDTLEMLGALVDKSLLHMQVVAGEPRFVMLETIREFASGQLEASGIADAVFRQHAEYYLAMAEAAEPTLGSAQETRWLERLEREHDNLRAALRWLFEHGGAAMSLRLAAALWRFWLAHIHWTEGRSWLEQSLDLKDNGSVPLELRARAVLGAGWLAHSQCDFSRAETLLAESLALYRDLGHESGMAEVLINQGLMARGRGDYDAAVAAFEESVALHRATGNRQSILRGGLGLSLYRLGLAARELGDYTRAMELCEECLSLHRALDDPRGVAVALLALSDIARDCGDVERVREYCTEGRILFEHSSDRWGAGFCLHNLAVAAYLDGNLERASAHCDESVAIFRDLKILPGLAEVLVTRAMIADAQGHAEFAGRLLAEGLHLAWEDGPRWVVAAAFESFASLAAGRGDTSGAGRFLGAAHALRQAIRAPLWPALHTNYNRTAEAVKTALGDDGFPEMWAAGAALPLEQAVNEALHQLVGPGVRQISA